MWSRGQKRDTKRERPDYNEFCSLVEPEHETDSEHLFNRYLQPVAFRSWRRVGSRVVLSMDYPVLDGEALIPTQVTQTIEGGDAFFLYAKRYHRLYETLFVEIGGRLSTAISFIRRLASHIDNRYLQDAFRAVMLLYVDKFGENKLIEVGICTERIISAWRWEAWSVRIEGTLGHVSDKRLIPILLESVNSLHAYSQLLAVTQTLSQARPELRPVQQRYYASLAGFYTQESSKILDVRAHSLASFYTSDGN